MYVLPSEHQYWTGVLDKEIVDWLLEGPAWVRYAVESQLLCRETDPAGVLQDKNIQALMNRLRNPQVGLPAIKNGDVHYTALGKAYWDLFFLADIGLSVDDLNLRNEAESIFNFQLPDGTFRIPPNVQPEYFCMSAILISSLARMGYRDDKRVESYIRAAFHEQLPNGGWDCYGDSYGSRDSCPMDDLNILMLLGQYENQRGNPKLNGAIDLLLSHFEDGSHLYGFGVGKRFRALQYPAVKYGILRVLDVLSLFPYAVASRSFQSMLDLVHRKAVHGKYTPEAADETFSGFDFGQTDQPSRWLTFLVARIEKRASDAL